jgi:hypothetical protein
VVRESYSDVAEMGTCNVWDICHNCDDFDYNLTWLPQTGETFVGLTESKIKDLEDKNFDKLFEKHEDAWRKMVQTAYAFTKKNVADGEPRPDDILKVLLPMLEVSEDLRKHQEDVHARYRRFREFFGDYIIDKELHKHTKEEK